MIPGTLARVRTAVGWLTGSRWRWAAASVLIVGLGLVPVLVLPTNSDIALYLFLAERSLEGEELYKDFLEVNPPLVVWLTVPPVAAARELGMTRRTVFIVYVGSIALVSVAMVHRALQTVFRDRSLRFRRAVWLLILASAIVIPDWAYGQREHLMYLLVLPYLVGSVAGVSGRPLPVAFRIPAAVLAGVGIALKPYYVLFWLSLEGWLWLRSSATGSGARYRPWRLENVIVAVTLVGYVGAVLAFTPEFFAMADRLAPVYLRVWQDSFRELLMHPIVLLAGFAGLSVALLRLPPRTRLLAEALVVGCVAWVVGAWLQTKGWWYHFYPAFAGSTVAIGLLISTGEASARSASLRYTVQGLALLVIVGIAVGRIRTAATSVKEGADLERRLPVVTALVDRLTGPEDDIVVFSPHVHAAFPLVNRVEARWGLPFASLWPLEVVYADAIAGRRPVEYHAPDQMEEPERYVWTSVLEALERRPPTLVLLDHERSGTDGGFDYREYFGRAASFRRLMRRCAAVGRVGRYHVLACEHAER